MPSKGVERIVNKLGIYITAVHKDNLLDYLTYYDNRPYMENAALANLDELVGDTYEEREDPFKTGYESPFQETESCLVHRVQVRVLLSIETV